MFQNAILIVKDPIVGSQNQTKLMRFERVNGVSRCGFAEPYYRGLNNFNRVLGPFILYF